MSEADHEITFAVSVKDFGEQAKVIEEVTTGLLVALHRAFGPESVTVTREGVELLFDPLAYDGEHIGHEGPIISHRHPGCGHGFHAADCPERAPA